MGDTTEADRPVRDLAQLSDDWSKISTELAAAETAGDHERQKELHADRARLFQEAAECAEKTHGLSVLSIACDIAADRSLSDLAAIGER